MVVSCASYPILEEKSELYKNFIDLSRDYLFYDIKSYFSFIRDFINKWKRKRKR